VQPETTDKKITMKRVIAISVLAVIAVATLAAAQSSNAPNRPLAQVAREEEARRKAVRRPAKVYTNGDLRPDLTAGGPPASVVTPVSGNSSPSNVTPGVPSVNLPAGTAPPPPSGDQAFWQNRIKEARDAVTRSQMFMDSLQSRINALQTDFVNRDDPAQRAKIEGDRRAAMAEFERVKKELDDNTKKITAIEDEARRAGVPAGWLRPGA
jgi:hypothetical protein